MHFYYIYGIIFHEKSLVINLKCLIDYKIRNPENEFIKKNIVAEYTNNEITFKDENDSIKLIINNDNIIMIKDDLSSKTTLNFILNKKTTSEYYVKAIDMIIDLKVLTNKLEINKERIYIEYEIWFDDEYSGKFNYEINIKEM